MYRASGRGHGKAQPVPLALVFAFQQRAGAVHVALDHVAVELAAGLARSVPG